MVSLDECVEGGSGRVLSRGDVSIGDVGEAMASSSGFAIRNPPRALLSDISSFMVGFFSVD